MITVREAKKELEKVYETLSEIFDSFCRPFIFIKKTVKKQTLGYMQLWVPENEEEAALVVPHILGLNFKEINKLDNKLGALKDILMHEIIHTIPGCYDHGQLFLEIGRKVSIYGYRVTAIFDKEVYFLKNNFVLVKKQVTN